MMAQALSDDTHTNAGYVNCVGCATAERAEEPGQPAKPEAKGQRRRGNRTRGPGHRVRDPEVR